MTNAAPSLTDAPGAILPSFSFSLLDSTATIICGRCDERIAAAITYLGRYAPSDGWTHPDESDPAEIDCETECPKCGTDLWPTVEKVCNAVWQEAHRDQRRMR